MRTKFSIISSRFLCLLFLTGITFSGYAQGQDKEEVITNGNFQSLYQHEQGGYSTPSAYDPLYVQPFFWALVGAGLVLFIAFIISTMRKSERTIETGLRSMNSH